MAEAGLYLLCPFLMTAVRVFRATVGTRLVLVTSWERALEVFWKGADDLHSGNGPPLI
jgi:hypothetical protein